MDTVETFREQLKLGLAAFEAAHPHPFLLMRKSGEEQGAPMARQATVWAPMAPLPIPPPPSEWADVLLFEVRARPGSFFPKLVSIGRGEQCDVSIPDGRISRLHASIECVPASREYWLLDAGSRNGTKLNGRNVAKGERVKLAFGDTIKLGELWLEFVSATMVFARLQSAGR